MSDNTKCTLILGQLTATLIIPIEIMSDYGFKQLDKIVVEKKDNGILIRKSNE